MAYHIVGYNTRVFFALFSAGSPLLGDRTSVIICPLYRSYLDVFQKDQSLSLKVFFSEKHMSDVKPSRIMKK